MPSERTARQILRLGLRLAVALIAVSFPRAIAAQEAAATDSETVPLTRPLAGPESSGSLAAPLVEQPPRVIYYAPDANQKPVPLINIPLSTIQQLLNLRDGLPLAQQPPPFQFNRVSISGVAREGSVDLDVELELDVLAPGGSDGPAWIALPLRFHDASLLAPPEYTGGGRFHLTFDLEHGYRGWLSHAQPGEHRLKLKVTVPLVQAAGSMQLRFFPPLGNRSELRLQVPGSEIAAEVENARNLTVEGETPEAGSTTIHAQDLRNQVIVTWRPGAPDGDAPPTYLDVRGDIRVTIDGPGAIRSNVTLDLQSYGRPIEQFHLRLPPHTNIVSGNPPGYTITEVLAGESGDEGRRTVQIKLEKPAPTARVQLVTQTSDNSESAGEVNVADFEVLDAIRQSGRVSLLTSEEWLVYWSPGPSVRRVANADPFESQDRKQLATFQYFRQPCQLNVQIQPQGSRVGVEPIYRLRVSEDRLTLEAQLNYKIRGARVSFLEFARHGWRLDDVGPNGAVENDAWSDDMEDPIPLRLTKATTGDLSLTLELHRPIEASRGTLRLPLPWPSADTVTPGSLIVSSADSVVVSFRLQEMSGLVQDSVPAPADLRPPTSSGPGIQTSPVSVFRFMGDRPVGPIVLDYEVRQQEQRVRMDTVMDLTANAARVSQRLAYRVLYEPVSRLQLNVPQALFELMSNPRMRNAIDIRLDGQSLAPDAFQELLDSAQETSGRESVPLILRLGRARLGAINLELRFDWPLRALGSSDYTAIPLVTPRDATVLSNSATLTPVGPLIVEPLDTDGTWVRDDDVASSESLQAIGLASRGSAERLQVRVAQRRDEAGDRATASATVIERAWLQTWLADEARMDRAVYRIATGAEVVSLRLPEGVSRTTTLVDGREVVTVQTGNELIVPLPETNAGKHTLEISLSYASRPPLGEMTFQAPILADAPSPQQWFWQLLVPADEHLIAADRKLTSANRWVRSGWFWYRTASGPEAGLEHWTGAITQPALPEGLNQYLFGSFGRMAHLHVRTCRRHTLVYSASAIALGLGLALLYWPALRHPAMLMLLAVVLAAGSWLYADIALLISQASLLGVWLALLAGGTWLLLQRWGSGERDWRWLGRPVSDSRSGPPSSWAEQAPPQSTISVPAPTMGAIVPDSKA